MSPSDQPSTQTLIANETPQHRRVVTWNINGIGPRVPEQHARDIVETLEHLHPQVIGLQEVSCQHSVGGRNFLEWIANTLKMQWVACPTRFTSDGYFGNALLSSLPIVDIDHSDLSVVGREPRGVLNTRIEDRQKTLSVAVTHFGLRHHERRHQATALIETLAEQQDALQILMGDFNEWWPRRTTIRHIERWFGHQPSLRTWPSWRPWLPLDRIWVHPAGAIRSMFVASSRSARRASDHLPVVANISMRS